MKNLRDVPLNKIFNGIGYVLGFCGLMLLFVNTTLALTLAFGALVSFDIAVIIELRERKKRKEAENKVKALKPKNKK